MTFTIRANSVEAFLERKRSEGKRSNRLIGEKSPYLLQHAFNPVDWFPWGPEAFEKARQEDKPIFLSIGYSTCYWCHVMERGVFENEDIASRMNQHVISIKVDREELPGVDRVYLSALMGMTGSGGWPMSMFLTPDLKPFFGATYIPPVSQYGRAGFVEILEKIRDLWSNNRQQFTDAGDRLAEFLRENSSVAGVPIEVDASILDKAFEAFRLSYDTVHGGFGGAPKFPTPVNLSFLLRYHLRTGSAEALDMVVRTLDRMRDGGIWDHLGGGLHRYSTDATWHVPHFEKMLYDQALCATAFLEAFQITGIERFAGSVRAILGYVSRDLTDPEGGFWSAEDAESAPDAASPDVKKEGSFYTWTKAEINAILTPDEVEAVERAYDIRSEGNVMSDPHGMFKRMNILHRLQGAEHIPVPRGASAEQVAETLRTAEAKLLRHRGDRPRPGLDDKVLASWNGLMISAFARASHVLKEPQYLRAAEKAGAFIFRTMWDPPERTLLHRYRGGEARFPGLLEDHAYLIQALIDLYESSLDVRWLQRALDLTEEQIVRFHDPMKGGFFDAYADELSGIVRTKEGYDGATPSGNAVSILNLLRLSAMLHEDRYRSLAQETLAVFGGQLSANPRGTAQFLIGLDRSLALPRQVVIAGPQDDPQTREILQLVHSQFDPYRSVVHVDGGEAQEYLATHDPFFGSLTMIAGRPTAYVCKDFTCDAPSSDIPTIAKLLSRSAH